MSALTGTDRQVGVFALSNGYEPPPLRPPTVIAELIAALQASPVAGPQTTIQHGVPPTLPTQRERVYLAQVIDYALVPNTRAHLVRNENFLVRGLIEVHQLGDDSRESAYGRAWALLSALDECLLESRDLDAGALYSGELGVTADDMAPATDGWYARIVFTLAIESRR